MVVREVPDKALLGVRRGECWVPPTATAVEVQETGPTPIEAWEGTAQRGQAPTSGGQAARHQTSVPASHSTRPVDSRVEGKLFPRAACCCKSSPVDNHVLDNSEWPVGDTDAIYLVRKALITCQALLLVLLLFSASIHLSNFPSLTLRALRSTYR